MKAPPVISATISKEELAQARAWLTHSIEIPEAIRASLLSMVSILENAQTSLKTQKKLVEQLRLAMGFIASSEKGRTDKLDGTSKEDVAWSQTTEDKYAKKVRDAVAVLKAYREKKPKRKPKIKKAELKATETTTDVAREASDLSEPAGEAMFQSSVVSDETKEAPFQVDKNLIPNSSEKLIFSTETRKRFDLSIVLTTIDCKVETVRDPITGFSATAKVDIGPSRFRITWETIVQVILIVFGMGMPMTRLASCLGASNRYFSSSRIWRICLYGAKAFTAIYIQLFKDLIHSDLFSGDDTHNSVVAMRKDEPDLTRDAAKEKELRLQNSKRESDPQKSDFLLEVEERLGSQMPYKNGKGKKQDIFTSVIIGEQFDKGKIGTVVFYHTERKNFGDLLGKILAMREASGIKNGAPIYVQSDLSPSNNPNPEPNLSPIIAACASHARRPFWKYRKDADPKVGYFCYTLILCFEKIFDADQDAWDSGQSKIVMESRKTFQYDEWQAIKRHCEEIQTEFAPNSDMYAAAEYVLKNFDALTRYLTNIRLRPDNNMAERLLRFEKIMLGSSKFRMTKKGRLAYDILRTVLCTCTAVGVEPAKYFLFVLKNQVDARAHPQKYTPAAFAKMK